MKILITVILAIAIIAYFFEPKQEQPSEPSSNYITYLSSTAQTEKYCNGDDMDQANYKKTITHLTTTKIFHQRPIKSRNT